MSSQAAADILQELRTKAGIASANFYSAAETTRSRQSKIEPRFASFAQLNGL
jgi:hypothetical protein